MSLDIETTGSDPQQDAILEIGVVVFRGEQVLDEWQSLIQVNRPVPPQITQLTGITDELVHQEGRALNECLHELEALIGRHPIIGHNIGFDISFFSKLRNPPTFVQNQTIDTFELAGILVPHAGRYSLGMLAQHLGVVSNGRAHRALNDAHTTHQLFHKLFERATMLPEETVEEIIKLYDNGRWGLALFWEAVQAAQKGGIFNTSLGAAMAKSLQAGRNGKNALQRQFARSFLIGEPLRSDAPPQPLDTEQIVSLLSPGGPFAAHFEGYESRPQQISMMRRIIEAFNSQGDIAIIEAGTGTGKSLAYLIPAFYWSLQNKQRVVVSTNTVNLQDQLIQKDVPIIERVLGIGARVAVMKGKGHYLCPNRLNDLRRDGARTAEEARVLSKILLWLPSTLEGNGDELFLPTAEEREVFHRLSADNPLCNANTCSATDCFFHQARQRAERAHVVIVNHALLLADIAVENHALPDYQYLVVDETHHLESATTGALTWRVGTSDIERELTELGMAEQRKPRRGETSHVGLLQEIAALARKVLTQEHANDIGTLCDGALKLSSDLAQQTKLAFEALDAFLQDQPNVGEQSDYVQRVRLTEAIYQQQGWFAVETAFDNFVKTSNTLVRKLNDLTRALIEPGAMLSHFSGVLARLSASSRFFTELSERMHHLFFQPSGQYVYWAEIDSTSRNRLKQRASRITLHMAPRDVGHILREQLWNKKSVVVLTSATLRTTITDDRGSTRPTFHFIKQRLGLEEADELALDSPFDYKSSALLYLVSDMPEPKTPGYQEHLNRGLIALFTASQGRGLALFTSYSQLRATARGIGSALERAGIMMLDQSSSSSRRAMIDTFRKQERAVMLGTRSFWEGVDIQGEQLSVVAICKLPFEVPNDPIFAARSEAYQNPFNEYSLPEAVLRFRQGFGRLIRSKRDRGVVVVFDSRVLTKPYGAAFIQALPSVTVRRAPLSELSRTVQEWLAAQPTAVS